MKITRAVSRPRTLLVLIRPLWPCAPVTAPKLQLLLPCQQDYAHMGDGALFVLSPALLLTCTESPHQLKQQRTTVKISRDRRFHIRILARWFAVSSRINSRAREWTEGEEIPQHTKEGKEKAGRRPRPPGGGRERKKDQQTGGGAKRKRPRKPGRGRRKRRTQTAQGNRGKRGRGQP